MKATIEHSFCPYCDEVTELYFRIINTILFSTDEAEPVSYTHLTLPTN